MADWPQAFWKSGQTKVWVTTTSVSKPLTSPPNYCSFSTFLVIFSPFFRNCPVFTVRHHNSFSVTGNSKRMEMPCFLVTLHLLSSATHALHTALAQWLRPPKAHAPLWSSFSFRWADPTMPPPPCSLHRSQSRGKPIPIVPVLGNNPTFRSSTFTQSFA